MAAFNNDFNFPISIVVSLELKTFLLSDYTSLIHFPMGVLYFENKLYDVGKNISQPL